MIFVIEFIECIRTELLEWCNNSKELYEGPNNGKKKETAIKKLFNSIKSKFIHKKIL